MIRFILGLLLVVGGVGGEINEFTAPIIIIGLFFMWSGVQYFKQLERNLKTRYYGKDS